MYYFLGLGGMGMSALAHILLEKGEKVAGFDANSSSEIIQDLQKKGAKPRPTIQDEKTVVYSSAFPLDHPLILESKKRQLSLVHRSELLQHLMREKKEYVVAGSHGKTSTSSLLSWVFLHANKDPSFAVGGVVKKVNCNGRFGRSSLFIAEGDESDGSFLACSPYRAVITSYDLDHMDYWKKEEDLQKAFLQFFRQSKKAFWCKDDPHLSNWHQSGMLPGKDLVSYGFSSTADAACTKYQTTEKGSLFSISYRGKTYRDLYIPLYGKHFVQNAVAVFALALDEGISCTEIQQAFAFFPGVKRRQEKLFTKAKIDAFDDYAHHPKEIAATLAALKERFSTRRRIAIFEPHRLQRLDALYDRFVSSFSDLDYLIVTDVYDPKDKRAFFDGNRFAKNAAKASNISCKYVPIDDLLDHLQKQIRPFDVMISLGAGILSSWMQKAKDISYQPWHIGLIFGGASPEHDVSIASARYFLQALQKQEHYQLAEFYISKKGVWSTGSSEKARTEETAVSSSVLASLQSLDIAFPMTLGPTVEDGCLQGFLETLGLIVAGSSRRGLSLSMHKQDAKLLVKEMGVATAKHVELTYLRWKEDAKGCLEEVVSSLPSPWWIKPASSGSSIGVKKAHSVEELTQALLSGFTIDKTLLVEEEIQGREIEVALLGDASALKAFDPAEVFSGEMPYDYEGKYGKDPTPCTAKADLTLEQKQQVQQLAKQIFHRFSMRHFCRIDFFLTEKGVWYFNEINGIPAFTPTSIMPKICAAAGMSATDVIDQILESCLHVQYHQHHIL